MGIMPKWCQRDIDNYNRRIEKLNNIIINQSKLKEVCLTELITKFK